MTWTDLGTYFLSANWQSTPSVSDSDIFRVTCIGNASQSPLQAGCLAQLIEETIVDPIIFHGSVAKQGFSFPYSGSRSLAFKQNLGEHLEIQIEKLDGGKIFVPLTNPPSNTTINTTVNSTVANNASDTESTTSVIILAQNTNGNRKGVTITNKSSANLYLCWGSGATIAAANVMIYPNGYYEMPFLYQGVISGIWDAAGSGGANVCEFQ